MNKIRNEIDRIDSAKEAIATAIADKGVTIPQGTLIDGMAELITEIRGGLSVDLVTVPSLPSTAVDGQIVVESTTPANHVYITTDEPVTAEVGDILIAIEPGATVKWELTDGINFLRGGLAYAGQWDGTTWVICEAYYGVNGAWEQFSTNLPAVGTSLESMSWADISKIATAGKGANYFNVGDSKTVKVNGTFGGLSVNSNVVCKIIGFNHNKAIEGNGIHFQFLWFSGKAEAWDDGYGGQYGTAFSMNSSANNAGGWQGSYMRNTVCAAFLNALPSDLRTVIKECIKYTDNTGGSGGGDASRVTATKDKIWLLSAAECFGNVGSGGNAAELNYQARYDYYAAGNSSIRYRWKVPDNLCNWWLRSPQVTKTTSFMAAKSTGGTTTAEAANYSYGFAPCFMV